MGSSQELSPKVFIQLKGGFKVKKGLTLLMICLFMVSLLATSALAQEKTKYTDTKKNEILQSVAYFSTGDSNEVKYSEQLADKYLQMSDDEFKKAIESNLKNIVAKINKGSKIYWNKDFVEKTIKSDLPEIYNDIAPQVKQQEKVLDKKASTVSTVSILPASYTPGNTSKTFSVYGNNVFGVHLYGFFSDISWSWNATAITDVTPRTYGEAYAPLWEYKGLEPGYEKKYGDTAYNVYRKGKFCLSYNSTIFQTAYPWLDIFVYAGGSSSLTSYGG